MRKKVLIILCLISIGLFSCKENKVNENLSNCKTIKVKEFCTNGFIELSDSFNIKLVRLETNPECIIGRINKVLLYKNKIYISDANISRQIYVFDDNGKFLRKIGRYGRGPKEYYGLNDICIYKDKMYVYTGCLHKITVYNLDGSFEKNIKLKGKVISSFFEVLYDGSFVTYGGHGVFNINFWKHNGKLRKRINIIKDDKIHWSSLKPYSCHRNKFYFKPTFSDMIYEVKKESLYPKFNIEFVNNFPYEKIKNASNIKMLNEKDIYSWLNEYSVSDNYFYYGIIDKKECHFGYTNLKTNKSYRHNHFFLYGIPDLFAICGDAENGPIMSLEPVFVKKILKSNKNKTFLKFHPEMFKVKKDDNPLLFIFDEKE